MRFPLALTVKIARHIIKHKILRTPRFALVLQLEPLHTCNLTCTGCGRIREYSTSLKDMMSLEDCLASAQECDAPMVSVCGGEPLIYPKIEELVAGLLAQRRIVYICTNGMFMRKKLKEYLADTYSPALEPTLARLLAEKLISEKDAETIRKGKHDGRPTIKPSKWLYWNVHIDGLEYTHDLIVEREGVFKECVEAIRMAKLLGYQVATNTTVYKETDVKEIEQMFEFFSSLEVDGHTISPGYDYDAAKKDMVKRLGRKPEDFFLTRAMTIEKFAKIQEWGERFTIFGTPVYQEFLAGKRELTCTAWAIPTRNIKRLESALLPDDRRPLRALPGNARQGGLEQIRRGERRRARPPLRELHGPLRLRSQRRARHELPARRYLEEYPLQLCGPSQAVLCGPPGQGLQRVLHRQGPSRRSQGRDQYRLGRREIRLPEQREQRLTAAALAAAATPPSGMSCWLRSARRRRHRSDGAASGAPLSQTS